MPHSTFQDMNQESLPSTNRKLTDTEKVAYLQCQNVLDVKTSLTHVNANWCNNLVHKNNQTSTHLSYTCDSNWNAIAGINSRALDYKSHDIERNP